MHPYRLVTNWRLAAPIEQVWAAIYDVAAWPRWWKYVLAVETIEPGDVSGVGAVQRYTWGSRLPYRLSFNMRSTLVQSPRRLAGEAQGELNGTGLWTLSSQGDQTHVRYHWEVSTSRAWMNALAPVLAPAFRWNHGQVMAEGERGLARYLAAPP
jgi:uncharacterized protein YndB with AHSA1/START domain